MRIVQPAKDDDLRLPASRFGVAGNCGFSRLSVTGGRARFFAIAATRRAPRADSAAPRVAGDIEESPQLAPPCRNRKLAPLSARTGGLGRAASMSGRVFCGSTAARPVPAATLCAPRAARGAARCATRNAKDVHGTLVDRSLEGVLQVLRGALPHLPRRERRA